MAKILITGSSGFVGRNLVALAKEQGHIVINYDLTNHQDILNCEQLHWAMKGCDLVIHLAAQVAPQKQFSQGLNYNYQVNITGFLNVIEAARQEGIKKFVYASSSAVYGRLGDKNEGFREDMAIDYTREPNYYGKSKMINEMIAQSYNEAYGMETIGFRLISAYGPGDMERADGGSIIAHLLKDHLETGTLELFGNGSTARDFLYITDCCKMILDLADKADNGVYNIGSGNATTVKQIAELLGSKITYKENPNSYVYPVVTANMSKTFGSIGHRALTPIEEGINRMLDYYKMKDGKSMLRQEPKPEKQKSKQ